MLDARLAGWPIWLSVGLHAVGLAAASSVVAIARHEGERVVIPVEVVRVEAPPPAPPEKPKMPRVLTKLNRVVHPDSPPRTLMQDPTPHTERAPDPVAASPEPTQLLRASARCRAIAASNPAIATLRPRPRPRSTSSVRSSGKP